MDFTDFYFPSSNGTGQIRGRKIAPEGEVKAVLQIAHGIACHIERYDGFMKFLASNGIAVCGNDHLGHGKSQRNEDEKGFFAEKDGWNCVVKDMKTLHDMMKEEYPDVPYIMFGHSMGSFLTRSYIIDYPNDYDLVILSGTAQQSKALLRSGALMADALCSMKGAKSSGEFLEKVAFGSYNNKITNPKTEFDWLSVNEDNVQKYIADELCGFTCKSGLYRDMMHGLIYITSKANIAKMNKDKPVYFMSGTDDPVGDYGKGVEKAYKAFCAAGVKDVTMKLYPSGRHEMLNETNNQNVYNDILIWINSRLSK